MPIKKPERSSKNTRFVVIGTVVVSVTVLCGWLWLTRGPETVTDNLPEKVHLSVKHEPVINYNKLERDDELKALMQQRKSEYNVTKGIDIIVKPNESLKVGDTTVSMQEIIDKIHLKHGDIIEKNIETDGIDPKGKMEVYGIYVVKPEDNIWNIHYKFLKDYFAHKDISLSPVSDEPDRHGFSSGVGKLLKFSENIVHIYNIKDRKLDIELNLILPLNKIIVYNMEQIFALLDQIDYEHVKHIQFDGETLWIPAEP